MPICWKSRIARTCTAIDALAARVTAAGRFPACASTGRSTSPRAGSHRPIVRAGLIVTRSGRIPPPRPARQFGHDFRPVGPARPPTAPRPVAGLGNHAPAPRRATRLWVEVARAQPHVDPRFVAFDGQHAETRQWSRQRLRAAHPPRPAVRIHFPRRAAKCWRAASTKVSYVPWTMPCDRCRSRPAVICVHHQALLSSSLKCSQAPTAATRLNWPAASRGAQCACRDATGLPDWISSVSRVDVQRLQDAVRTRPSCGAAAGRSPVDHQRLPGARRLPGPGCLDHPYAASISSFFRSAYCRAARRYGRGVQARVARAVRLKCSTGWFHGDSI